MRTTIEYMQLCHNHLYQKIARKKVARVNAALGGQRLRDFLLATNQRAQFRLRHNLGYVAGLAALIDTENIAHNQHSYTV